MKKLYIFIALVAIPYGSVFSQELTATNATTEKNVALGEQIAPEGTFILIPKSKSMEVFTKTGMVELRKKVEQSRKDDEDVSIEFSPLTDILIPSRKKINAKGFVPYQTLYE